MATKKKTDEKYIRHVDSLAGMPKKITREEYETKIKKKLDAKKNKK